MTEKKKKPRGEAKGSGHGRPRAPERQQRTGGERWRPRGNRLPIFLAEKAREGHLSTMNFTLSNLEKTIDFF